MPTGWGRKHAAACPNSRSRSAPSRSLERLACDSRQVKNITVKVPDDVYRHARLRAAERGKSVSTLVAEFLQSLSSHDSEFGRLEALQRRVQDEITGFRASEQLDREQVHHRAVR